MRDLDLRHQGVDLIMPDAPSLPPDETEWAKMGASPAFDGVLPTAADLLRDPMHGLLRRLPWQMPVRDARGFVPGFVRAHAGFWEDHVLLDHPLRDTLVSYLRDGVDLHDLLLPKYKGASSSCPYNVEQFPQRIFSNHRWPAEFDGFVDAEMRTLLDRGCIVKWSEVRGPSGPERPRMLMALSVETSKPRRSTMHGRSIVACGRSPSRWTRWREWQASLLLAAT